MTVECRVCAGEARAKFEKSGIEILECIECGLAFWVPDPTYQPEGVYGSGYFGGAGQGYDDYASLEPALRANFAKRLKKLSQPRSGARLLDLGAALGFAVSEAERAGFAAFGLEVSRAAVRRAAAAAPGGVVAGNALRLPFRAASFDAVTLWDVLEHLSDPAAAVREIARVLVPGGRLLLTTGDVGSLAARLSGSRWHLYTLPEHLFFFSRRSLRLLLDAEGFEIQGMRAESAVYPLAYLVERLSKSLLGRTAAAQARWPGAALRVPLNLFDIVTVDAVKGSASTAEESPR